MDSGIEFRNDRKAWIPESSSGMTGGRWIPGSSPGMTEPGQRQTCSQVFIYPLKGTILTRQLLAKFSFIPEAQRSGIKNSFYSSVVHHLDRYII